MAFCEREELLSQTMDEVQVAGASDARAEDDLLGAAAEDKPLSHMQGEDDAEDNIPDEPTTSSRILDRPLDERPRTTKHLYTTKRTMRTEVRRANRRAAAVKFLSLAVFLVGAALAVVLRGKMSAGEEDEDDEEEEEEDEREK